MGLVALGNITDFGTNYAFVEHVFAMDTTFRSPNVMWRAVTNHAWVTAAYITIIAWELLTAIVLAAACLTWVQTLATRHETTTARQLSSCGWLMHAMLFGGGFITIGGEWFEMWQSSKWNGLQPALQNFLIASVGLILTHLAKRESSTGAEPTDKFSRSLDAPECGGQRDRQEHFRIQD
jgi:predicted small integral membrane protein